MYFLTCPAELVSLPEGGGEARPLRQTTMNHTAAVETNTNEEEAGIHFTFKDLGSVHRLTPVQV